MSCYYDLSLNVDVMRLAQIYDIEILDRRSLVFHRVKSLTVATDWVDYRAEYDVVFANMVGCSQLNRLFIAIERTIYRVSPDDGQTDLTWTVHGRHWVTLSVRHNRLLVSKEYEGVDMYDVTDGRLLKNVVNERITYTSSIMPDISKIKVHFLDYFTVALVPPISTIDVWRGITY